MQGEKRAENGKGRKGGERAVVQRTPLSCSLYVGDLVVMYWYNVLAVCWQSETCPCGPDYFIVMLYAFVIFKSIVISHSIKATY